MDESRLRGSRYVSALRVSNASLGETSAEAQDKYLRARGDAMGMIYVDTIDEIDITGSMPGRRDKLEGILTRKREKNDFDAVLIQRIDRLTRSGAKHGMWFEHECAKAGIKIVFVGDEIPDGRYGDLIKVAKYSAAQEQAFSISQRSAQGMMHALEQGRCVTSGRTPYGCDRLYLTSEGQPSHIIRDLRDGRQQKLHPKTHEVLDHYGEAGNGVKGHYRKQKQERVLLIPGDAGHVATVREIFDLHFRQGWGSKRIAGHLNEIATLSPMGGEWSQNQVEVIYSRECYTGRSVGNRTSSALYHERARSAPKAVAIDEQLVATRKYLPKRERPVDEWFIQDQPLMVNFLDLDLRTLAIAGQEDIWLRRMDPSRKKRTTARRSQTEYLLTGLLHAKQDDEPLVGVLCGRSDNRIRYYRHRRGARAYKKGGLYNRMIQSAPLENAVLAEVENLLSNLPDLDARIAKAIEEQISLRETDGRELEDLRKRRDQIKRRVQLIFSTFQEEDLIDAETEIQRLRSERERVDRQIEQIEGCKSLVGVDAVDVARRVRDRLGRLREELAQMDRGTLQQALKGIVEKVAVDLESKAVTIHFALSSWIMHEATSDVMRPGTNPRSSVCPGTHRINGVQFGIAECKYRLSGSVCYDCSRRHAA